jgi:uncharacterized phage-associated protein
MAIQFNTNHNKAMQVLLWILNKKPGIDIYNAVKVAGEAERYHLNHYGRPIYGDSYEAWKWGTVPVFIYGLTGMTQNMPFYKCSKNGLVATAVPDTKVFSESDIEALEYGMKEYGYLKFSEIKQKNHKLPAWKKYESRIDAGEKRIKIEYDDLISNRDVLDDLCDLGSLTLNMVF